MFCFFIVDGFHETRKWSCNGIVLGKASKYKLRYSEIPITSLFQLASGTLKLLDFNKKKCVSVYFPSASECAWITYISVYCSWKQFGVSLVLVFFENYSVSLQVSTLPNLIPSQFACRCFWMQFSFGLFASFSKPFLLHFVFRVYRKQVVFSLSFEFSNNDLGTLCVLSGWKTIWSQYTFWVFPKMQCQCNFHLCQNSFGFSFVFSKAFQFHIVFRCFLKHFSSSLLSDFFTNTTVLVYFVTFFKNTSVPLRFPILFLTHFWSTVVFDFFKNTPVSRCFVFL